MLSIAPARRVVAVVAVLLGLVVAPGHARAQDEEGWAGVFVWAYEVGLSFTLITVNAGGVATIVANSVYLGLDERPRRGWVIAGYTLGGLQVGLGLFCLLAAPEDRWEPWVAVGASTMAGGATAIGLAIAGTVREQGSTSTLKVVPLAAGTRDGGTVVGLAGVF